MTPISPAFYDLLERRFGEVRVANPGEAAVIDPIGHTDRTGGARIRQSGSVREDTVQTFVSRPGEYYRICCPYCGDTRFRLWVNHLWPEMDWMIVCYNENCLSSPERRQQFRIHLLNTRGLIKYPKNRGTTDPAYLHVQEVPGEISSLSDLPDNHPTNDYLYGRGFYPRELAELYGVGHCHEVNDWRHNALRGRLYIPIVMEGDLVGWQGRYVGERSWKEVPKYYGLPGMPKRLMLYNFDRAKEYEDVIVEEGVFDVWTTGPCSVGILGHTISYSQKLKLGHWKNGVIIMLLDSDAAEENRAYVQEFRTMFRGVVEVNLPDGTDPGSFEPEVVHDFILTAVSRHKAKLGERTLEVLRKRG